MIAESRVERQGEREEEGEGVRWKEKTKLKEEGG